MIPVTVGGFFCGQHRTPAGLLMLAGAGTGCRGRFLAEVALVNAPRRSRLAADPVAGTAETTWHTEPLHAMPLATRALPVDLGVA